MRQTTVAFFHHRYCNRRTCHYIVLCTKCAVVEKVCKFSLDYPPHPKCVFRKFTFPQISDLDLDWFVPVSLESCFHSILLKDQMSVHFFKTWDVTWLVAKPLSVLYVNVTAVIEPVSRQTWLDIKINKYCMWYKNLNQNRIYFSATFSLSQTLPITI